MNGTVADVPFLSAPGFIKAVSKGHFQDVSDYISGDLILNVRSSTADYTGFRVTFSADGLSADYACGSGSTLPFSGGCFKANFKVRTSTRTSPTETCLVPEIVFVDV